MNPRAVLFITIGFAVLAAGCGSSSSNAAIDQTHQVTPPPFDGDEDSGSVPVTLDGSVRIVIGSPLCNATFASVCYPDNWAATNAKSCGLAPDGGAFNLSGGNDNAQLACHIERSDHDAGVGPTCTATGTQTDTSSGGCTQPTDCKEGYECVSGGTCRRYCCGGECLSPGDFCDIQATEADRSISVPVCMPIRSCGLLDQPSDAGACPRSASSVGGRQTCAVVRENGATGCVAVGLKQAGEECDTDHCGRGLVCLGPSGQRRCYILCHTAPGSTECASTPKQTCLRSPPLFPVPGIGICE